MSEKQELQHGYFLRGELVNVQWFWGKSQFRGGDSPFNLIY